MSRNRDHRPSAPGRARPGRAAASGVPRGRVPGRDRRLELAVLAALLLALTSWWRLGSELTLPGLAAWREAGLAPIPTPAPGFLDPADEAEVQAAIARVHALAGRPGAGSDALGEAQGELGQRLLAFELSGADAAFANARQLQPTDHRWPYYLGYMALRAGRADEAVDRLREALALAPNDTPARLQLAELYIDSGRLDEAETLIQEAQARDSGYYWVHALAGRLAAARSDHRTAVRHFERALALEPEAAMLKRPLAMSYRSLGDATRSEQLLAEAGDEAYVRFDPLLAELQGLRRSARATLRQAGEMLAGQPRQALLLLATVEAQSPDDAELYLMQAEALMRLGDLGAAASAAQRATGLAPEGPLGALAQQTLGRVLLAMGANDGAASAFQRAIALNPDLREALQGELSRVADDRPALQPMQGR